MLKHIRESVLVIYTYHLLSKMVSDIKISSNKVEIKLCMNESSKSESGVPFENNKALNGVENLYYGYYQISHQIEV